MMTKTSELRLQQAMEIFEQSAKIINDEKRRYLRNTPFDMMSNTQFKRVCQRLSLDKFIPKQYKAINAIKAEYIGC